MTNPLAQAHQYLHEGAAGRAADLCREIIAREPGNAEAHQMLGVIAGQASDFEAAEKHLATAIALKPHRSALPIHELANLLWRQGRIEEAARAFEQVLHLSQHPGLDLDPGKQSALLNDARFGFGSTLSSLGFHQRAVTILRELERQSPDYSGLQVNLGLALMKLGRCAEAIACYDRAIAANPDDYRAHNNRGNALGGQQRMAEAVSSYRRTLAIKPDHASAHSNLLLNLNYTEPFQEGLYRESLRFDVQHAAGLLPILPVFRNVRSADRVLRVGYVSADFRQHSVAFFLGAILACHDRERVRVCCYASVAVPDAVTARLQGLADEWVSIAGLSDAEAAERIRADGIDILVDLGGHTGGNRLLVFARRPAPVQVSWLGYPNTTGLRAMDFRLTDAVADPVTDLAGEADALHSEELIRLPQGFLCYQPTSELPDQSPLPRKGRPELTFGSFNLLTKITADVIRVWSEILQRLPASRLLLKSEALNDPATRRHYAALFGEHGVAADRLEFIPWIAEHRHHLELYSRVDIALDSFPYNGTTTTCEAQWMGVPVVTLRGSRHAARVGASILSLAGLPEWVAEDERGYIDMAVTRGRDREALAAMRAQVGARMRGSPLVDSVGFTRSLERAYRDLWARWCAAG